MIFGWCSSKGLIEIDYSACLSENDEPCIYIDYVIIPFTGYNRYA